MMNIKKRLLKVLLLAIVYIVISVSIYFVLRASGYDSVDKIREFVEGFGAWSYLVFFIIQVTVSTFVCIIPFEDEVLTMAAIMLFGPFKGFLVASFNMFATSCIQFALGRLLCKDVLKKFLGGDVIFKYQNYLKVKGEIVLPILYAIPLLPHDSLCILAGVSKMRFCYFAPVTAVMRSIEIASLCFLGSGLIDFSALTIMDWIILVNVVIIDVIMLFKLYKYLNKKFSN